MIFLPLTKVDIVSDGFSKDPMGIDWNPVARGGGIALMVARGLLGHLQEAKAGLGCLE